jgi:CRISPR-associated exonuclease Cas4
MAMATASDEAPLIELTVTDLAQSAYCRRLPYYRLVLPVAPPPTYMMMRGREAQATVEALERRRGLREYGLDRGERVFGLRLRSPRLGLAGQLDLLVKTAAAAFPVDFKNSEGPLRAGQRVQLAAYALLVEETLGLRVPAGYIYFVPRDEVREVPLGEPERDDVRARLRAIRALVAAERLPPPTKARTRCAACEYRNYCGDVW